MAKRKRILHVEKQPVIRERVAAILGPAGFSVSGVGSIERAKSAEGLFDLIICNASIEPRDHFDGLLFATEQFTDGNRVLILAHSHKFKKIPFFPLGLLADPDSFKKKIEEVIEGAQ